MKDKKKWERIYNRYSNILNHKLICSIPWIIIVLLLTYYVLNKGLLEFETNDDFYMEMITGGAFGECSPYTVYTNIFVGYELVFLHWLMPMHNWFTILQLTGIVLSFLLVGVLLINRSGILNGYIIAGTFLLCSFDSIVCRMNYSKTGAFIFITGLILFLSFLDHDDWKNWKYRLGRTGSLVLMLQGSLMRDYATLVCVPFAAICVVYIIYKYKQDMKKRFLSVIIATVIVGAFWMCSFMIYSVNAEWKAFKEYDNARIKLLDYDLPEYSENMDLYTNIGFSENDHHLLKSWQNGDIDFYSKEKLEKIANSNQTMKQNFFRSEHIDLSNLSFVEFARYHLIILLLLPFSIVVVLLNPKRFYYIFSVLVLGYGELWASLMKGRLNERSLYIPMLAAFLVIAFFVVENEISVMERKKFCLTLLVITFFAYYGCGVYSILNIREGRQFYRENASEVLEYTSSHPDSLFVMDIVHNSNMLASAYGPFDDISSIPHENIATLGGWIVPTPIWKDIIGPFGDRCNLIKTLVQNKNVYLLVPNDYDCSRIYLYIKEHYNPNVQMVLTDEVGNYAIFSFI